MSEKNKFQVDRIALFSDAVFAIAITLMVIEVKPPHLKHHISDQEAIQEVVNLLPLFGGVILSFVLIGRFWLWHHLLMKHMENYNGKLLRLNLAFLLPIVLIPFATAFVFENVLSQSPVPLIFYNVIFNLATVLNYRLFRYVLNPSNGIMSPNDPERITTHRVALLFDIGIYLLVIALSLVDVVMAPMAYALLGFKKFLVKRFSSVPVVAVVQPEEEP